MRAAFNQQWRASFHQIAVIIRLTIQEARRRKLIWIGLALGGVFITLFSVGFYFGYQEITRQVGDTFGMADQIVRGFQMAGLYVVNFLIIMVTVLTVVGTVSVEISSNTIHAIAAKPIRRWEIIIGKWIGHAILVASYTSILTVGILLPVYLISGYVPPRLLAGLGVLILESLTVLSLTLFGSTLLSTIANGVLVFMLYGVAFVGGWVEQFGFVLNSQTAQDIGIATSLFMPSEALWRYASGTMQAVDSTLVSSVSPFSIFSQPTPAFLVYAITYTLVLLGLAVWTFSRRDF
jgi:ABC-type transport system involved in multi-copper enzyme maturation permease subunit